MNGARRFVTKLLTNKVSNINYEARRYGRHWILPTMLHFSRAKRAAGEQPVPVRSSFLDWNRDAEIYAFNVRLSENFDTKKLEQAFTHKSYIIQEEKKQRELGIEQPHLDIEDNQAFISNGQKLVSEITYKYLSECFPRAPFEAIQAFHDYLLSETTLATISRNLGTKDLILAKEYPPTDRTLADTFYALVAALAESVDINHASKFVRDFLIVILAEKDLNEIWSPSDPIEILNEILAKQKREPAEPRIIAQNGVNTLMAVYQIAMYSNKQYLAAGFGQSIREAKEAAAMNSLFRICNISDSSNTMKFS